MPGNGTADAPAEMTPIIKTLLCRDFFFSRIIWWVNGPTDNTIAIDLLEKDAHTIIDLVIDKTVKK
jgi:hypothetical protein